jgi:predicted Rossmann-fold nucleotide-binding protein
MRSMPPVRKVEVDTHEKLVAWLEAGADKPPAVFQGLDLVAYAESLVRQSLLGCAFFGCRLGPQLSAAAEAAKCLIYAENDHLPFRSFRATLYTPDELYAGFDPDVAGSYRTTPDSQIYLSYADLETGRPRPAALDEVLARRIHDHSIEDAVAEYIGGDRTRVVAIMGGHDRRRDDSIYRFVAHLAHRLANRGYLLATGGGPGLMEAANLGAFCAAAATTDLDAAIAELAVVHDYHAEQWLATAWRLRRRMLAAGHTPRQSLGIPTWFYGHETSNVFATAIAKYFENSVREEGLLAIALGGVIFAEGNAGTVQEIFQDACQNYYRTYAAHDVGVVSPMILLGSDYWDPGDPPVRERAKPVVPLLATLAREMKFEDYLLVTHPGDARAIDEIVAFIAAHPPLAR